MVLDHYGWRFCTIVMLPRRNKGLSGVEERMTATLLADALDAAVFRGRQKARVWLPRFSQGCTNDLVEPLRKIGLGELFSPRSGALRGIAEQGKPISRIEEGTWVALDEKGAAPDSSAEGEWVAQAGSKKPFTFRANRPFIYMIYDRKLGQVLLMGKLVRP